MKVVLSIVLLILCTLCQAHIKMNSFNDVSGATTSRNGGQFSTANTDGCGGNAQVGANGLTNIWPGHPLDLVWEMNDHAALPNFRIAFSPNGSKALFDDNVLVDNIQHNGIGTKLPIAKELGQGVYSRSITGPRELCSTCSIQVLHTGYDWAGCFDINITAAPCGGSCATTGIVENGKLDYKTGEVTCNSGYKKTSDNTCVSTGMGAAAAFFLSIFIILMVCIIVFAVLVALRKTGNLPDGIGKYVEKGEHLTAKAFNKTKAGVSFLVGKATGSSSSSTTPASSPAATEAQTQQAQVAPVASPGGFFKGMQCQAKYTADGQYYRAVIKDINAHTNQYLVNYPEYGSEEWLPVTSLKR